MNKVKATAAAGASIAGLFAALSLAAPGLVEDEGWILNAYADPVSITTACAGVTGKNVKPGVTYTQEECVALSSRAMLDHAIAIRRCIPADNLPTPIYASFIRFAYNAGSDGFCKTNAARKASAGDLAGACRAIQLADDGRPVWVWATKPDGTRVQLPGLVRRRGAERKLCDEGVA